MDTLEERIATLARSTFDDLPTKSKPRIHPDGSREWVPMSAVVLVRDANSASEQLTCVALATGCKCLTSSSLTKCHGQVLHDSHAEVLALRGLNYFLLSEVSRLLNQESLYESQWLGACSSPDSAEFADIILLRAHEARWPPFAIRSKVSIHMFSTEAPCGDASMEILMSELGPDESVPWETPRALPPASSGYPAPVQSLQGRGFFSDLGKVRRKPSRADAEPTISKSCTDKLSVKEILSLLSFPTDHFIARTPNAYLSSLVLPATKYSNTGCSRAFSPIGRLSPIQTLPLPDGYSFHPFNVIALPKDFPPQFPFSKPPATPVPSTSPPNNPPSNQPNANSSRKPTPQHKAKATNLSALSIHNPHPPVPYHPSTTSPPTHRPASAPIMETLLSGLKQGYTLTSPTPKKASIISRFRMLELGKETARSLLSLLTTTTGTETNFPLPIGRSFPVGRPLPVNEGTIAELRDLVNAKTYANAKAAGGIARERKRAKGVVTGVLAAAGRGGGWPRNEGDDDWGLRETEDQSG